MPRRLTLAHALSAGQPNLPIQIHSENPPTLPVTRKGKGGRLLRRPQQAHPAATVADFRTAVLTLALVWLVDNRLSMSSTICDQQTFLTNYPAAPAAVGSFKPFDSDYRDDALNALCWRHL